MPSDEWYREEYRGREDELISSAEILELTGYTRGAVSKWRNRHADMPEEVCKKWREREEGKRGHGAFDQYWVRDEMLPFLEKRLSRAKVHGGDRDARYEVVSVRLREDIEKLEQIAERERNLKDELSRLREEREKIQIRAVDDQRFVAAYERDRKNP
ncbi:hypothetical protein [Streptomyces noursei]|uniref:Uncharacterized protein n=1 Tax=Streptomyces noursei TaxID=1971 RepID=A0A2N8PQX0_STRNR|nr:hypothetical protein [Streptomyces noursei]PNE43418.1 hypothetical protein AOB60_00285 [Streptomyces noursei]